MIRRFVAPVLMTVSVLLMTANLSPLRAQTAQWPQRPITFVVPSPAGGGPDLTARAFANAVSNALGQPIVVDNRPGASGQLGANIVAKAKPDGYTFLVAGNPVLALIPHVRNAGYDPFKDFVPVSRFADPLMVLAVSNSFPASTLPDFIAYAKAKPIFYGSIGLSVNRLLAEVLQQRGQFTMTNVAYKGEGEGVLALQANDIQMMGMTLGTAMPQIVAGKLKALALLTSQRLDDLPNVPPITDTYPDFPMSAWFGVFAPAGTPPEIVSRMAEELNKAAKTDEVKNRLKTTGSLPRAGTPAELATDVRKDYDLFGNLVTTLGLKE